MIIVAKKNSNPAILHAVTEDQLDRHPESEWLHEPEGLSDLLASGKTTEDLEVTEDSVIERTPDPVAELLKAKERRYAEIDAVTTEMIDRGFQYDGAQHSLSRQAQANLLGTFTAIANARAAGTLAAFESSFFPATFNTLDDESVTTIADVIEFQDFYFTAMGTVRACLDSGTSLKNAVRTAETLEDVNVIVDTR